MIRSCPVTEIAPENGSNMVKHGQTISSRPRLWWSLGKQTIQDTSLFSTHPQERSTKVNKSMNCGTQYLREQRGDFLSCEKLFGNSVVPTISSFSPSSLTSPNSLEAVLSMLPSQSVLFDSCFWMFLGSFRSILWKQIETLWFSLWSLLSLDSAVRSLAWPTETQHTDAVFGCWSVWFWCCSSSSASANFVCQTPRYPSGSGACPQKLLWNALFPNMKSETRRMQDKGVHCYLYLFIAFYYWSLIQNLSQEQALAAEALVSEDDLSPGQTGCVSSVAIDQ